MGQQAEDNEGDSGAASAPPPTEPATSSAGPSGDLAPHHTVYTEEHTLSSEALRSHIEQAHLPQMDQLQARIGYRFESPALLRRALTHRSYANEFTLATDNQRLEFLGDAVLDLIISTELFNRYQDMPEGRLSYVRSQLVREESLARRARELDVGVAMLLGKGEALSRGESKDSVLADAVEALLAAIYLDGGYKAIYTVTQTIFGPLIAEIDDIGAGCDYKTRLQEYVQAGKDERPRYSIVSVDGPPHARTYTARVAVGEITLGQGQGCSKKGAHQEAARNALERRNVWTERLEMAPPCEASGKGSGKKGGRGRGRGASGKGGRRRQPRKRKRGPS